jgi:hypothetical protein
MGARMVFLGAHGVLGTQDITSARPKPSRVAEELGNVFLAAGLAFVAAPAFRGRQGLIDRLADVLTFEHDVRRDDVVLDQSLLQSEAKNLARFSHRNADAGVGSDVPVPTV